MCIPVNKWFANLCAIDTYSPYVAAFQEAAQVLVAAAGVALHLHPVLGTRDALRTLPLGPGVKSSIWGSMKHMET